MIAPDSWAEPGWAGSAEALKQELAWVEDEIWWIEHRAIAPGSAFDEDGRRDRLDLKLEMLEDDRWALREALEDLER